MPQDAARKLALHTVLGAAKLAASSSEPPATLRKNVTSKGGTTEAALKVFEEEKLAERFRRAVEAASRRATELGEELGKEGTTRCSRRSACSWSTPWSSFFVVRAARALSFPVAARAVPQPGRRVRARDDELAGAAGAARDPGARRDSTLWRRCFCACRLAGSRWCAALAAVRRHCALQRADPVAVVACSCSASTCTPLAPVIVAATRLPATLRGAAVPASSPRSSTSFCGR